MWQNCSKFWAIYFVRSHYQLLELPLATLLLEELWKRENLTRNQMGD
jgi:hypothetical protein